MGDANNPILAKMLDRLVAGLLTGPNLNCRPHHSRQRVDLALFANFQDISPTDVLRELLGAGRKAVVCAKATAPKNRSSTATTASREAAPDASEDMSPDERRLLLNWQAQQSLLAKLRVLTDDARTYEQDTGVPVLNLGYPLLSLPPDYNGKVGNTRRILAPLAFIPVTITIRGTVHPQVEIACRFEGADTVAPNPALLAWIERQTGKPASELFEDPDGSDPWREFGEVLDHVTNWLGTPAIKTNGGSLLATLGDIQATPRAEALDKGVEVINAAVLGLFPANNQGLLRDMQAMVAGNDLQGPVEALIRAGVTLDHAVESSYEHEAWSGERRRRDFTQERLVSFADPCQCRATRLARTQRGLVIHGPPGTGKSQTITNIIGDHLSRGERVLMVCDKRTALDVVANRLEHLGLGELCALVHDPQHDQRDLYRNIREQLESLTDKKIKGDPARQVAKSDAELKSLHDELTNVWQLLMRPPSADDPPFHQLAGRWLISPDTGMPEIDGVVIRGIRLGDLEPLAGSLDDLFTRAERVAFHENPWPDCSGQSLDDFLARPMQGMRDALAQCMEASRACDAASYGAIPPFCEGVELAAQAQARLKLADMLEHALKRVDLKARQHWASQDNDRVTHARQQWLAAIPLAETFGAGPLDSELALVIDSAVPTVAALSQQLATLGEYLAVAGKWYGFLFFRRSQRAGQVQRFYGLTSGQVHAERLRTFLSGVKARLVLGDLHAQWSGQGTASGKLTPDVVLQRTIEQHPPVLELLVSVQEDPALKSLQPLVAKALVDISTGQQLLEGLRRSPDRANALDRLRADLESSGLFAPNWIAKALRQLLAGKSATKVFTQLQGQLASLEDVLRVRDAEEKLPAALQPIVKTLLKSGLSPPVNQTAVRKAVLQFEISCRLEEQPDLRQLDAHRLERLFVRYRECEAAKRQQVRDGILHHWTEKQRQRLLATTGTRLNGLGAETKRRFTSRGEKAVRLRQAVALGQGIEGGDPLFDLKPVWLASPETVAQIFPRQALFDVVVFDEASQCRLEEALPVLTRAKRVVIAGDPKQLPPTRFFETALATSDQVEIETDDQLFESVQGEIEDLLGAALSLEIEQSYLDVHYRSCNADLIAFSNEKFYSSRLQAIPGHPSRRTRYAPITLYHANGIYKDRTNEIEAREVCRIVHDLLRRAEPPSIGIACFNLQQRDLIVETLNEFAEEDREFGTRLAEARSRRGQGSFEGLFVKNLENVQGDERDHIIISTTYGPDPNGRFYRRFGPLGRAGGGRRLNVLVTRARHEVHLVTSVPPSEYRQLEPMPVGQVPSGSWLLYSYLQFAEKLAELYEAAGKYEDTPSELGAVSVLESQTPSPFAEALGDHLQKKHRVGSVVHWGNEGFCIDVALRHPAIPGDATIGVLCDGVRFEQAEDPVEWDVFRTAILEATGWQLHRVWSPLFFRDAQGQMEVILRRAKEYVHEQPKEESID